MTIETTYDTLLEPQFIVDVTDVVPNQVSEHLFIKGSSPENNSKSHIQEEIWNCPWDNINGDLVLFI